MKKHRKKYSKIYRESNKDVLHGKRIEYRQNNRSILAERSRVWRVNNLEKVRTGVRRSYEKNKHCPVFRLKRNLRRRLTFAIKGEIKSARTMELIGCTIDYLRGYLESQFEDWMTWDNYGMYRIGGDRKWVVDHIIPCASFDLSIPEEQRKCFHYTNLQPMCSRENTLKSDKIQ